MAKINPVTISWSAPTLNTDGTPIVGALSYRLMVDGVDFLDFPGSLNPDGKYYEDVAPMAIPNGAHTLALKAFYVDEPSLISDPSGVLDIIVGVTAPAAPFGLAAS